MIKIDLVTGFLGSGKTTFMKGYVRYLLKKGLKVGVLLNDHGAVNVDMMLLKELEEENLGIEMVAGGCDADCHKRRFKTKLIALAMSGYDRVVVEPSGVFDIDEFFDSLHEEPLDRWYQAGSVIAIADAMLERDLSPEARYLLASECAYAGKIVLSKTQLCDEETVNGTKEYIKSALKEIKCDRYIDKSFYEKDWGSFTAEDYEKLMGAEYVIYDYLKLRFDGDGFSTVYVMNKVMKLDALRDKVEYLLHHDIYGKILRVKGFMPSESGWAMLNATKKRIDIEPIEEGQEIVIIIGENLREKEIQEYFCN